MKKTLSIILAIVMALGAFSITAFAETPKNQTDITAIVPDKALSYEMVIPATTTLTEESHENVLLGTDGKVSITKVTNATDKVNVYYTVDLSKGTLTDGTNTIDATYKYKQAESEFAAIDNSTKVTVYENKTVKDSFVNVTADNTQWNSAPAGTYNASVTFNFKNEEVEPERFKALSDILATVTTIPSTDEHVWNNNQSSAFLKIANGKLNLMYNGSAIGVPFNTNVTKTADNIYYCTAPDNATWTFTLDGGILQSVTVAGSSLASWNGTYEYRPA